MAAGVALAGRGVRVTVFESGPVPGGRARRVVSQGNQLDNGQHIFVGAYTELFRLMRVVGAAPDALLRMPLQIRYADGFTFSAGLAGLLLGRLSLPEKVNAVRFMATLKRMNFRVEPDVSVYSASPSALVRVPTAPRRVTGTAGTLSALGPLAGF